MKRKLQIFISSTHDDLVEERQKKMCIRDRDKTDG